MENSKKYIELEVAKQAIMGYIAGHTVSKFPTSELCRASRMGAEGAMYELELVPAADVEEVRHGEWVLHKDGSGTCSHCKTRQKNIWDFDNMQNYCGHCGAKMDGKRE